MTSRTFGLAPRGGSELTLGDLRELVEDTAGLPADALIRAQPAMRDAMNPVGMPLRGLSVQYTRGPRPTTEVSRD